jgi:hypothetical protein
MSELPQYSSHGRRLANLAGNSWDHLLSVVTGGRLGPAA